MELYAEHAKNGVYEVEEGELISKLQEEQYGYTIQPVSTGGVTGITVKQNGTEVNATTVATVEKAEQGQTEPHATLTVIPASGDGTAYYILDDGIYYEISLVGAEITIGEGQETIGGSGSSTPTLTVGEVTGLETEVSGLTITVVGRTAGDKTLTVSYGGKTATVKVTVTEAFTVNLYSDNTAEATVNAIRVVSGGSAFTAEGYAVPTAPVGKKFDKWVLKEAVGGNAVGADATSLLGNVTQGLNVYATYVETATAFRSYGTKVNESTYGNTYSLTTTGETIKVDVNNTPSNATDDVEIADNWKIFYEDDDFLYLIYGDYYPLAAQTTTGTSNVVFSTSTDYPYAVYGSSSRDGLLKYLRNHSGFSWASSNNSFGSGTSYQSWSKLQEAISGLSKMSGKTISVQAAPDIDLWVASWNAKGNTSLKATKNSNGYNIMLNNNNASNSNYYINVSTDSNYNTTKSEANHTGYYDTLYFPYTSYTKNDGTSGNAYGYWLASPGGRDYRSMCCVRCLGDVYCLSSYSYALCARPVVSIQKSGI